MVNKVILIGNLGSDPELRTTASQQSVCSFSLATSEKFKDKEGNQQEKTEWHKIVVWGNSGEATAKYLKKGSKAFIEGRLQTRKWQDKDGNDKYTTEIVAHDVKFLDGKPRDGEQQARQEPARSTPANTARGAPASHGAGYVAEEDVPF